MRKLALPVHSAKDVFSLCISRVRNKQLRARLISAAPVVVKAADDYVDLAESAMLHTLPRTSLVGKASKAEMVAVYSGRMVPKKQPGRPVYNALMAGAPRERCPLCGVRTVTTLDHHLPKSEYPALTIVPFNLIPSCMWCQNNKMELFPSDAGEQTLHPYYDDVSDIRWLGAEAVSSVPAAFKFNVLSEADLPKILRARLERHMKVFGLQRLFALNAAEELVNIRSGLQRIFDTSGAGGVREHLRYEADSREEAYQNSWPTAMYRAAQLSDWFCDGGFAGE